MPEFRDFALHRLLSYNPLRDSTSPAMRLLIDTLAQVIREKHVVLG
jgi:hypothetical protein